MRACSQPRMKQLLLPEAKGSIVWSSSVNRELIGEVKLRAFFWSFLTQIFKYIFICRFLPFTLPDLQPSHFALENLWEVFSEPSSFSWGATCHPDLFEKTGPEEKSDRRRVLI